jgi:uncharacterized protein involved in exopolysaccharide biosynthesis
MLTEDREQKKRPQSSSTVPRAEVDLFDCIAVVLKYRRLVLLLSGLAVVLVGSIVYLQPARYEATAAVVPPVNTGVDSGLNLPGGGIASLLGKGMTGSSVADLYMGILQSRTVADAIVERFDLTTAYGPGLSWHKARATLRGNTRVKLSEEGIIQVTVEDADPNRAAALANAYIEELDRQNKKLASGQAASKKVFLENRLREVEAKLDRNDNILSREVNVQEALYALLIQQYELAKIEEAKSMPTIQVLDPAIPPQVRKARGTVMKALLAGIAGFMASLSLAFGREYVTNVRRRRAALATPSHPAVQPGG